MWKENDVWSFFKHAWIKMCNLHVFPHPHKSWDMNSHEICFFTCEFHIFSWCFRIWTKTLRWKLNNVTCELDIFISDRLFYIFSFELHPYVIVLGFFFFKCGLEFPVGCSRPLWKTGCQNFCRWTQAALSTWTIRTPCCGSALKCANSAATLPSSPSLHLLSLAASLCSGPF